MAANTTFHTLTSVENGIILSCKNKNERKITYFELDKIFIKVYKLNPLSEFGFILLPFLLLYLSFQYIILEKAVFLAFMGVIPVYVKTYKYKSYRMTITLKNGTLFRKKVSMKLKDENMAIVKAVKREQLNYYYKTKGLQELEESQFCQDKAS